MSKKINLTIQAILDKQFSVDFKGYCASEVDAFLDLILEDVDTYLTALEEINERLSETERMNAVLRDQVIELEAKARSNAQQQQEAMPVSQLDLLKRISRLEQAVYGNRE